MPSPGASLSSHTLGSKGDELTEDNVSTKLTEAADSTDQMSVLEEKGKQGIAKTQGSDVFIVPLREDPSSPDDAKVDRRPRRGFPSTGST